MRDFFEGLDWREWVAFLASAVTFLLAIIDLIRSIRDEG